MANIDFTDSIYDAQQGSQSAIKFIYDNTIQLFYKEANAFMRDKNAADRAIRDAYVFIFDHLDSLEDTSKFLLWANEVCKNTCISKLIESGVFNERIPAEAVNLGEISPASDYDPQINLSASMSPDYIQECLEAVLGSLPDNQRACAVLWGEGYPINSISRKLGISPVAVNYTLAYTLGNITNSVNTLSANGLPLFAMEPIPYFLWLLMCYYQFYQPGEAVPGSASSFSSVLRRLMPDEASVYSGEYMTEGPDYTGQRVQQVTSVEDAEIPDTEKDTDFADFVGDELDLSTFIRDISDEVDDTDEDENAEESGIVVPPMDVISPHEGEEGTEASAEGETEDADETDGDKEALAAGLAAAVAAGGEGAALDKALDGSKNGGSGEGNTKKHTGLIAFLIVLAVILCLIIVALLFFREQVNSLLGTNFFNTTQVATEPETTTPEPETTTPEPETTTPEPETTTPEPETTTPEPETTTEEPTTEEDPGPEYDVQIYAEGYSLSMKDAPEGEGLLYIPADETVHIYETQDGWGHTYYDGLDGWIWLGYTKVSGKARVVQPENLLDPPQTYTMQDTEFGNELRTGPSNHTSTFGPIPAGTELTLEGYYIDDYSSALWCYTSYNGQHGWVFLYYYYEDEEME